MLTSYIKSYLSFYMNLNMNFLSNKLPTWSWLPKFTMFLDQFKSRNYLMWNEGLVIDFAQKKTIDLWLRKSVMLTGFLFTDRFLFETIVSLFNDNIWLTLHHVSTLETENTVNVLNTLLFTVGSLLMLMFIMIMLTI